MALLGVLSIVQIVFLPGYLLTRVLRLGGGALSTLVLAFALSLIANHALVAGLVVLGIYRPASVYAVFALEAGVFLWVERALIIPPTTSTWCPGGTTSAACRVPSGDGSVNPRRSTLQRFLLAAASLAIAGFALASLAQIGQIFQQWDAVVSWKRWAVDWAANHPPHLTSLYPQLLPTNISLTYVFMQSSEIWIFAKAFQFLFCLMLLLAILDAARVTGNFGFVPGVLVTYGLLVAVLRFRMLSSGYADMPLAFFSFAAVYALFLAKGAERGRMRQRYLMVSAVLAAGAALTKQTGLYIVAVYPLLAWLLVLQDGQPSGLRRHAGTLLRIGLLSGALAAPWYLYKFAEFHAARDDNNTALLLTDFHEGRSVPQRMLHGAGMLAEATTPAGAVLLLLAIGFALRDPLQRWLVVLVVVPLGLIWAAAFSYDLRNLALVLPFAGAAAGMGLWRVVERFGSKLQRSEPVRVGHRSGLRVGHLAGLLTLALAAASLCVSDQSLREWQDRQQRLVGIPELNQRLYDFFESHAGPAVIATDYQAMDWLPELGPRSVRCTCEALNAFRATYDRPEVRYVLVRKKGTATAVQAYLDGPAGRPIFEACGYCLYEKS